MHVSRSGQYYEPGKMVRGLEYDWVVKIDEPVHRIHFSENPFK